MSSEHSAPRLQDSFCHAADNVSQLRDGLKLYMDIQIEDTIENTKTVVAIALVDSIERAI
jgi:hypothetical protein